MDKLASVLLAAKAKENKALAERIEAEKQLIQALGVKDDGSKTHKLKTCKVTITQPIRRTIDLDKYDELVDSLEKRFGERPPEVTKTKRELDTKALKDIQKNIPKYYKYLTDVIVSKPGKIGVVIIEG